MLQPANHRKPILSMIIASFALITTALFQNCASKKYDENLAANANGSTTQSSLKSTATSNAQIINVTYSLFRDGLAQNDFTIYQVIQGKVSGLGGQNIASCTEVVGSNTCSRNDQFTDMPNHDWTYDGSYWRTNMTLHPEYAGKSFRTIWLDKATGHKSAAAEFKILASNTLASVSCNWEGGMGAVSPCSAQTKSCSKSAINSQAAIKCANGSVTQVCVCK